MSQDPVCLKVTFVFNLPHEVSKDKSFQSEGLLFRAPSTALGPWRLRGLHPSALPSTAQGVGSGALLDPPIRTRRPELPTMPEAEFS